jgi:hypothetical protein
VQKKKRNAKAKERRRRLKAQREQSINGGGETASHNIADSVASTDQAHDASTTREAAVNNRRARRTQERRVSAATDHVAQRWNISQSRTTSAQHTHKASVATNMTNGHVRSYSEAYHKSTAPIDRTETDWFKLRAMGIDPSKHRKRSFDSATDEERKDDAETKRVRRSDSNASLASQPLQEPEVPSKPLTIEERLARIRDLKQSFRGSVSGASYIASATPSKRSSFDGRSSLLISQARELIAKSPSSKQSPISVHDFGRSVPNLGTSTASFRQSNFGKSVGASQSKKPAYWGRASRFVPQHLYGKGPEAIRAYRDQYVSSPSSTPQPVISEPLALSSPIPTQFSYIPQPDYTQHSETESASEAGFADVNADDNVAGDTEEDSFDGDDEVDDNVEDVEYDNYARAFEEGEDDYSEEDEEDEDEQFAQPGSSFAQIGPGATQDDAIELSD